MRKVLVFAIIFVLFNIPFLVNPATVNACTCLPYTSVKETAEFSDGVFLGKIVSTNRNEIDEFTAEFNAATYVFSVSKVWKGDMGKEVRVKTEASSAACGSFFDVDKEYVVYVNTQDGEYLTGLCNGNQEATASYIAEVTDELGSGTTPGNGPSIVPSPTDPQPPEPSIFPPGPEKPQPEAPPLITSSLLVVWMGILTVVVCGSSLTTLLLLFKVLRDRGAKV